MHSAKAQLHLSQRARLGRVHLLLAGIVAMSVADLLLTLTHLKTLVMAEVNPIAALVIQSTQSAWSLTAYKIVTVLICVSLIYRIRTRVQGELAAWICVGILAVLTIHWQRYSRHMEDPVILKAIAAGEADERWVTLQDED